MTIYNKFYYHWRDFVTITGETWLLSLERLGCGNAERNEFKFTRLIIVSGTERLAAVHPIYSQEATVSIF